MAAKTDPPISPESPAAPPALKFIGSADVFVDGYPQAGLEVVAEPAAHHQVTPEVALRLMETGLYIAADKYEPPVVAEEVNPVG